MAFYNWRCAACEHVTEVERKMADIDTPPAECESCHTNSFTCRVPVPSQSKNVKCFVLEGDRGWQHTDYSRYRAKDW